MGWRAYAASDVMKFMTHARDYTTVKTRESIETEDGILE